MTQRRLFVLCSRLSSSAMDMHYLSILTTMEQLYSAAVFSKLIYELVLYNETLDRINSCIIVNSEVRTSLSVY